MFERQSTILPPEVTGLHVVSTCATGRLGPGSGLGAGLGLELGLGLGFGLGLGQSLGLGLVLGLSLGLGVHAVSTCATGI